LWLEKFSGKVQSNEAMRTLRAVGFLLLVCAFASGQSSAQSIDVELQKLREFLKLPDTTGILPSTAPLPKFNPLKVFVATGADTDLHKVFLSRINNWNKKNGLKHGSIEVVSNVSEAQVILAWYSVRIEKMAYPPDGNASAERICCPDRGYSYLLSQTPDGLEMLSRIIIDGYSRPEHSDRRGDTLRVEFFKRMKARKT
jgi:hypothetical protein